MEAQRSRLEATELLNLILKNKFVKNNFSKNINTYTCTMHTKNFGEIKTYLLDNYYYCCCYNFLHYDLPHQLIVVAIDSYVPHFQLEIQVLQHVVQWFVFLLELI